MTLKQAIKYLESLNPEVYCKYAKAWGEMTWRMPTEVLFAKWIKSQEK